MWDEIAKWAIILGLVCFGLGFAVIPIMSWRDSNRRIDKLHDQWKQEEIDREGK